MVSERVFGPEDWRVWLDRYARVIFKVSGEEFAERYAAGEYAGRPVADDLACALPFIRKGSYRG